MEAKFPFPLICNYILFAFANNFPIARVSTNANASRLRQERGRCLHFTATANKWKPWKLVCLDPLAPFDLHWTAINITSHSIDSYPTTPLTSVPACSGATFRRKGRIVNRRGNSTVKTAARREFLRPPELVTRKLKFQEICIECLRKWRYSSFRRGKQRMNAEQSQLKGVVKLSIFFFFSIWRWKNNEYFSCGIFRFD